MRQAKKDLPAFRRGRKVREAPIQPAIPSSGHHDGGPAATVWSVPVNDVESLMSHMSFKDRLTSGLVFVQNKRPMADFLVHMASDNVYRDANFTRIRESQGNTDEVIDRLCLKRASRSSGLNVTILECDVVPTRVPAALTRLATAPGLRRGVWVRGHLQDLHPAHLRLFDAMFLFDMSDEDAEVLRSAIPLPSDRIEHLRARGNSCHPPEQVLVFTAGTDRGTGARLPEVSMNPAVLPLCPSSCKASALPEDQPFIGGAL